MTSSRRPLSGASARGHDLRLSRASSTPINPIWETFTWENGFAQIVISELGCNWLLSQENSIDPVHFEWLHNDWSMRLKDQFGYAPTHLKIAFDEFDQGFGHKRLLATSDESDDGWAFPRMCIMPNLFCPGATHFEYKVPVDDRHTLHVIWNWDPVPTEHRPYVQARIPHWYAPVKDAATGRWITSHVVNQDTVAWVGQGVITDRENEHLGRSDVGVAMLRARLDADLRAVAEGRDPTCIIRDTEESLVTWLFAPWRAHLERDFTTEELRELGARFGLSESDYFVFYAGRPPDVRDEYKRAMGLS